MYNHTEYMRKWRRVQADKRRRITARYYQRHKEVIKIAATLKITMKQARMLVLRTQAQI